MDNELKVKDLYQAALLYAKKAKLLRLERERGYYLFVFENKKKCQELADNYWRGDISVNAKEFSDSIRSLKDRLFAQK